VTTRRLRPAPHGTLRVREPAAGTLALLLNLPAGLLLLAVLAWPVLYAGWLSLHEVSLRQLRTGELPFTGLANYVRLFGDDVFWLALRHTVVFVAVSVVLEVAIGLALLSVSHAKLEPLDLVKACQRAEHEYVGTRCGIMDQFIAVFARAGHALMLDCRSLEYQTFAIPGDARLVISNSMVKHDLASGEYNRRRADCEAAVNIFHQSKSEVRALRDVSMGDLEKHRSILSDEMFRRCRHVVSENQRVLDASKALHSSDLDRFGTLMYQSHYSLRDDYEVSCRELDLLVEVASSCEGVYGSRMTGGGFGGCTVTLVHSAAVQTFRDKVVDSYRRGTGLTPDVYVCSAAQGAGAWQERAQSIP